MKTKVKNLKKTPYNMGKVDRVLQQQNYDSLKSGDAKLINKQESLSNIEFENKSKDFNEDILQYGQDGWWTTMAKSRL